MIATMEQRNDSTRRQRLSDLLNWLVGQDRPVQISVRPYCRVHRDTLMNAGSTQNGQTHYYCPTCGESVKVRQRVV